MPSTSLILRDTLVSIVLALVCAAVPWLARRLRSRLLVVGLALGIALSIIGSALALPLYPWTSLVVLLVALTGGLLLGRIMPPRFLPVLVLLLVLSALDVLQVALTSGASPPASNSHAGGTPSGPLLYVNFVLPLPGRRYLVGIFDLLVITALAERWRRRGASYLIALLPGALGFLLVYATGLLTPLRPMALLPFFTAGWLASEGLHRFILRRTATATKPDA
jgi:hypothetical protein